MAKSPYPIPSNALVLFNPNSEIFLAERINIHEGGIFGLPGGKNEKGLGPLESIQLECYEETRIRPLHVVPIPRIHSLYYGDDQYICQYFMGCTDALTIDFIERDGDGKPKSKKWQSFTRKQCRDLRLMAGTIDGIEMAFDIHEGCTTPQLMIFHFDLSNFNRTT